MRVAPAPQQLVLLGTNDTIEVQVHWSAPVVVLGVPTLLMDVGYWSHDAYYTSGSGTTALTFEFSVRQTRLHVHMHV
jgi:hypothetical protein